VVECLRPGALDFDGEEPFRADLDLDRAREALAAARGPGAIWLELACNGVFGQPVSLDGLDQATALARERGARLYLDASRSLENAALLRRRDPGARDLSVRELLARTLRPAHAVSASCLKSFHAEAGGFVATDDAELARALEDASIARGDGLNGPAREVLRLGLELSTTDGFAEDRALQVARFHERLVRAGLPVFRPEAAHAAFLDAGRFLPHLAPADAPARALALALYLQSGIRIDAHYLPDAPESAGRSVVRLAVPARRWFDDQLDWVAEELAALHARRETTPGLERLPAEPGLSGSLRGRYRIKEEP
jgi:tryptophanase